MRNSLFKCCPRVLIFRIPPVSLCAPSACAAGSRKSRAAAFRGIPANNALIAPTLMNFRLEVAICDSPLGGSRTAFEIKRVKAEVQFTSVEKKIQDFFHNREIFVAN